MKKKATPYIRWSSQRQDEGDSKERQEQAIKAVGERLELELQPAIVDKAVSSKDGNNFKEGFSKLKDVPTGEYVIIYDWARLGRSGPNECLKAINPLIDSGIKIIVCRGSASGGMVEITKDNINDIEIFQKVGNGAAGAKAHNDELGECIKAAWRTKKGLIEKGKYAILNYPPPWIRQPFDPITRRYVKEGTYELIPERVKLVEKVFAMYLSGRGVMNIVEELNAKGIRSLFYNERKQVRHTWQTTSIYHLLTDGRVLGYYVFPDGRKVKLFPPIIDQETFDKVKTIRDERANRGANVGRNKKGTITLFKRLLKCAKCGGNLIYHSDRHSYRCNNSRVGLCPNGAVSFVEWRLRGIMKTILDHSSVFTETVTKGEDVEISKVPEYEMELTELRRKHSHLVDMVEAMGFNPDAKEKIQTNLSRQKELEGLIVQENKRLTKDNTAKKIVEDYKKSYMRNCWEDVDKRRQIRDVLYSLLDCIECDTKGKALVVKIPGMEPIKIKLFREYFEWDGIMQEVGDKLEPRKFPYEDETKEQ